jgi:hypothetical protein
MQSSNPSNSVQQALPQPSSSFPAVVGNGEPVLSASPLLDKRSTTRFDQTFLSVGYAKRNTRCRSCHRAVLPQHVKLGMVRQVMTSRFPCTKAHWYHPLCLPTSELHIVHEFGSKDGLPFSINTSPCDGMDTLTKAHQELVSNLLTSSHPELPPSFIHVGPMMHTSKKRKRTGDDDVEFLPPNVAHSVTSTKRRFSGACRLVVQDSIAAFKQQFYAMHGDMEGMVPCAVSGAPVSSATAHVDHAPLTRSTSLWSNFSRSTVSHIIPPGVISYHPPSTLQAASLITTLLKHLGSFMLQGQLYESLLPGATSLCPGSRNLGLDCNYKFAGLLYPLLLSWLPN